MKGRKFPDPEKKESAYRQLNGLSEEEMTISRLSRKLPQLDRLVDKIYQHRLSLCTRAHLDFEDADIAALINTYEQMNRLCASLMYDQGWFDAYHETQS